MSDHDKSIGIIIFLIGILIIGIEFYFIILNPLLDEEVTTLFPPVLYWSVTIPIFILILVALSIFSWIGLTMYRTPAPEISEFQDFGKDIQTEKWDDEDIKQFSEKYTIGSDTERIRSSKTSEKQIQKRKKQLSKTDEQVIEEVLEVPTKEQLETKSKDDDLELEEDVDDDELFPAEDTEKHRDLENINGISTTIADRLREAGLDTVNKIATGTIDDLTEIKGIGKKTAQKIMDDINT